MFNQSKLIKLVFTTEGFYFTDGCVQFGWEVEEKCYELLHDKNSNWD